MTDEVTTQPVVDPAPPPPAPPIDPATPAEAKKPDTAELMVPKSRFDELNKRLKEIEKREADLVKASEEAARKAAEEQGEFKTLYETERVKANELAPQVETLTAKVAAYEAVIVELLDARIKALGDGAKTAVANLPGAPDSLAKLQWLNANEALFKAVTLGPGNQTKTKTPGLAPQGAQQMAPARPIVRL